MDDPDQNDCLHFLVEIDETKCIGCAAGASIAPALFDLGLRGTRVRRQPSTLEEVALAETAALLCPVAAISVRRSG